MPPTRIAQNKALVNATGWLTAGRCREPLITVPDELVQRLRRDLESKFAKWLAPAGAEAVEGEPEPTAWPSAT